jgi:hypothetical protein
VVTGGEFISEDQADSNDKSLNLDNLKATHEEADTRMILHMLHCKNVSNCRTIAVSATDTDVFLLLLHHAYGMDIKIWMMAGTSKSRNIIPIHCFRDEFAYKTYGPKFIGISLNYLL